MTNFLTFVGVLILMFAIGYLCAAIILPVKSRALSAAFALPIFATINTVVILLLGIINIPLSPLPLLLSFTAIGIVLLYFFVRKTPKPALSHGQPQAPFGGFHYFLAAVVLTAAFAYGFTHAVLLPTFHYDSATNWNMRSKIAFTEQKLPFSDEHDLIRKPHYPPLYHALQITAMQGQTVWKEPIANGIHFLLALSAFTSLFFCLGILRGSKFSLVLSAMIVGIPLLSVHMAQEYADALLIEFALLSLVSFLLYLEKYSLGWLLLSSVCVGACVLTKSEGLPFCLLPWCLMLFLSRHRFSDNARVIIRNITPAIALTALWLWIIFSYQLALSPHGNSDLSVSCEAQNFFTMFGVIFSGGSFGITWFMLMTLIPIVWTSKGAARMTLIWGGLSFLGLLAVYGCTENDIYLLSGQSFDRQMLLPASLLLLSSFISLIPAKQTTTA